MVQLFDAVSPSTFKQKWEKTVHQTRKPRNDHFATETKCHAHMLKIGFTDTGGMVCKCVFYGQWFSPLTFVLSVQPA